jgi:hypothetical protein
MAETRPSSERLRRVPDACCNGHADRLVGLLSEHVVRLHRPSPSLIWLPITPNGAPLVYQMPLAAV